MSEFLNLTRKDYAQQGVANVGQQQQQNTNAVNGNNANSLKTTDVFTAAKNGMTAQNKAPQALDGGNSGFSGVNAFGEEGGYGDTVSFSTKTDKTAEGDTSSTGGFTGKLSARKNVKVKWQLHSSFFPHHRKASLPFQKSSDFHL